MLAEREGFEPPIPVKVCLISSQVHSTGLCHLSALAIALRSRHDGDQLAHDSYAGVSGTPALISLVGIQLPLQRAVKDGPRRRRPRES